MNNQDILYKLINYIKCGNLDEIKNIVREETVNLNYRDNYFLILAIQYGYLDIVKYIYSITKTINYKCFINICVNGNLEIFKYLISIIDFTPTNYCYELAIRNKNYTIFYELFKIKRITNKQLIYKCLCLSSQNSGDLDIIKFLIDIYDYNYLSIEPLISSLSSKNINNVKFINQYIDKSVLDYKSILKHSIFINDIELLKEIYVLYPEIENIQNIDELFLKACEIGNLDIIRQLLLIFPNINLDVSMFNIAIKKNNLPLVLFLKSLSTNFVVKETNIIDSIKNNNLELFCILYKNIDNISILKSFYESCLNNSLSIANYLLNKNRNLFINQGDKLNTLFINTCKNGYYDMVIYLLPLIENIDFVKIFKKVGKKGYLDILKLVYNIVINKNELDYQTVFYFACKNGFLSIVKQIILWNSNNLILKNGFLASFLAGHINIVKYLCEVDNKLIDLVDNDQLLLSINSINAVNILEYIVDSRKNFKIRDELMDIAIKNRDYSVVDFLINYGIKLDEYHFRFAIKYGNLEIVKLIYSIINVEYNYDFIKISIDYNYSHILEYLLDLYTPNIYLVAEQLLDYLFRTNKTECVTILFNYIMNVGIELEFTKYMLESIKNKNLDLIGLLDSYDIKISNITFNNSLLVDDINFIIELIKFNNNFVVLPEIFLVFVVNNNFKLLEILKSANLLPKYDLYESGLLVFSNKYVKINNLDVHDALFVEYKTTYTSIKNSEESCIICYEKLTDGILTQCNHYYHKSCLLKWLTNNNFNCPYCRQLLYI